MCPLLSVNDDEIPTYILGQWHHRRFKETANLYFWDIS